MPSCATHAPAMHAADVQAYLNGVESPAFKNFFTVKTFVAKVIGSSLAVGSSLVMVSATRLDHVSTSSNSTAAQANTGNNLPGGSCSSSLLGCGGWGTDQSFPVCCARDRARRAPCYMQDPSWPSS